MTSEAKNRALAENIQSSPVWDTFCLADQIYDLINSQFLCRKRPKPVKTQYLRTGGPFKNKEF